MLHHNARDVAEFGELVQELEDMSNDFSRYLEFLLERRGIFQQVLADGPSSNN